MTLMLVISALTGAAAGLSLAFVRPLLLGAAVAIALLVMAYYLNPEINDVPAALLETIPPAVGGALLALGTRATIRRRPRKPQKRGTGRRA